jgi:hypothetical protein
VLTGINFAPGATVTFSRGGVAATDITVVSTTVNGTSQITITLDVTAGATLGPVDVTVTNPGGSPVTLAGAVSVTAPPTVTSVSPTPVLRTGLRQSLRLTGTDFQAPTQSPPNIGAVISGSGITVQAVSFNAPEDIVLDVVVAVDALITPRAVTVTNPDGGTSTSDALILLADPTSTVIVGLGPRNQTTPPPTQPTITAISPPSARRGEQHAGAEHGDVHRCRRQQGHGDGELRVRQRVRRGHADRHRPHRGRRRSGGRRRERPAQQRPAVRGHRSRAVRRRASHPGRPRRDRDARHHRHQVRDAGDRRVCAADGRAGRW